MNDILENAEGYYSFPRITEDFDGQVIKLSARETNLLFQTYTTTGCPHKFVSRLDDMDIWFSGKPYRVYKDGAWIKQITDWLKKDREKYNDT